MEPLPTERVRTIESTVTDWQHEHDVPGVSIILVDADSELYAEGFGARDIESNAPATPDTLYGMASITKPFTALAVLQLAEQGALSVDDAVDAYVDHYTETPGDPITLRELLSHTSGVPAINSGLFGQLFGGLPAGIADESDRKRLVREASQTRVTDEEQFFYHNTGYSVLGQVVEAVDGRSYPAYVDDEILTTLGMERSGFDRELVEGEEDTMTGYPPADEGEPPEEAPLPFEELIYPAGGLISSVRDLSRFLRAMMTDGSFDGGRVCSAETRERLQQPRSVRTKRLDGTEEGYGFGWMHQPLADDVAIGHGGAIVVSTTYAGYLADAGVGVVVACNTTPETTPGNLGQAILAIAAGHDRTVAPAFALKAKCETLTGRYADVRESVTATVERNRGGLSVTVAHPTGEETFHAVPSTLDPDEHDFYMVSASGDRNRVEFDVGGDQTDLFFQRYRLQRTGPAE